MGKNFELWNCVSDFFLQNKNIGDQFVFSIPDEHFDCFLKFINIFHGETLHFEENLFSSWVFLIYTFGLSCLLSFIPKEFLSLHTLQEALSFLLKPFCQDFEQQFNQSVSLLLQHFDQISLEQFLSLPNSSLFYLFSSSQLKIPNEDFLLKLIMNLIDKGRNSKCLSKSIRFPFVSSTLLIDLF
jgi:hypothetical protein